MTDKVDLALDDVVAADKPQRKPRGGGAGGKAVARGGGRAQARAQAHPYPQRAQFQQNMFQQQRMNRGGRGGGMARAGMAFANGGGGFFMHEDRTAEEVSFGGGGGGARAGAGGPKELSTGIKMLISNLGPEVTEEDLQDLCTEHGGPVKKLSIFFKADGTSTGTAEVVFKSKPAADKMLKTLQGVPLDGHPLNLALVGVPAAAPVAQPQRQQAVTVSLGGMGGGFGGGGFGGGGFGGGGFGGGFVQRGMRGRGGGMRGGGVRGGGRGGRGGGAGGARKQLTDADLDKGLDDYFGE
mmetsp:Transcript_24862/g.62760  ORF Transcript_24862/g.62760 Transcript_24862/m.62760 type:complete len:296 (-) Transcript_24862:187-1074(-)